MHKQVLFRTAVLKFFAKQIEKAKHWKIEKEVMILKTLWVLALLSGQAFSIATEGKYLSGMNSCRFYLNIHSHIFSYKIRTNKSVTKLIHSRSN